MAEIASTSDIAIMQFVATQGVKDVVQEGTIQIDEVMNPSSHSDLNSAAKTTGVVTEVVKDPGSLISPFVDLIQATRLEKPNTDLLPKVSAIGAVKHHRLSRVEQNEPAVLASNREKKSRPYALIQFPPSQLGLIQGPDGTLITKPESLLKPKKKKGHHLGSKNKTPSHVATKEHELSVFCPNTPPSPDPKGKNKMQQVLEYG